MKALHSGNNFASMTRGVLGLLFMAVLCYSSVLKIETDLQITFEEYVELFNKSYSSEQEYEFRKAKFQENLARLQLLDCDACGVTKFTDRTTDEKQKLKGHHRKPKGAAPKLRKSSRNEYGSAQYPSSFDWRTYNTVTSVKDQGECGNCWAFSTVAFFESELIRRNQATTSIDLSEQFILNCDSESQGCDGGFLESAMDLGLAQGVPTESQYRWSPYTNYPGICSQTSTVRIPDSQRVTFIDGVSDSEIIEMLLKRPLNIAVAAEEWENYSPTASNRIMRCDSSLSNYDALDHTVLLVGYTETQWIVKNQWNTDWGVGGFMYVTRDRTRSCGIGWEIQTLDFELQQVAGQSESSTETQDQGSTTAGSLTGSSDAQTVVNCGSANCAECFQTSGVCARCIEGFGLDTNRRVCSVPSVPGCAFFVSWAGRTTCSECFDGTDPIQNSCLNWDPVQEQISQPELIVPPVPQPIPIQNQDQSQNQFDQQNQNFFFPGDQQFPQNPTNQQIDFDDSGSLQHQNLFFEEEPLFNEFEAEDPSCGVSNCAICYADSDECYQCLSGYGVDEQTFECEETPIQGCNYFFNNGGTPLCFECYQGLRLSANSCI